jgi:ATP-dependent DNA ligase
MQQASDSGGAGLTYFVFDLLELDGENLMGLPVIDRKRRLAVLFKTSPPGVLLHAGRIGTGGQTHTASSDSCQRIGDAPLQSLPAGAGEPGILR